MAEKTYQHRLLHLLIVTTGCIIAFFFLISTTLKDASDLDTVVGLNTPLEFSSDPAYSSIKSNIIDRPVYIDTDSYYWITFARSMVENNNKRVRFTSTDNAPYGREVHWSNSYIYYHLILGKIYSTFSGDNLSRSIEITGRYANTILAGIFGLFWAIVFYKKFNFIIASIFPLTLFLFGDIQSQIRTGNADHHALQMLLFLSQLLSFFLAGAGFITASIKETCDSGILNHFTLRPTMEARWWIMLSSFFGAFGLWVSATHFSLIIGIIGISGLLSVIFWKIISRKKDPDNELHPYPELWRWWGVSGATFSIAFYLLEYFPDHFSMRLEVNHPLYALAWLGGSEILFRVSNILQADRLIFLLKKSFLPLLFGLCAVLFLPVLIIFGNESYHFIHDSVLLRTHSGISEFMPPSSFGTAILPGYLFNKLGLLPLCILPCIVILFYPKACLFQRLIILQSLFIFLFFLIPFLFQLRWINFLSISLLVLFLVFISSLFQICLHHVKFKKLQFLIVLTPLLFLSPHWIQKIHNYYLRSDYKLSFFLRYPGYLSQMLPREIAINLSHVSSQTKPIVLCRNSHIPVLSYFNVARGVGGLYWENREGIYDYSKFWAALTDREAYEVINRRKVTHVYLEQQSDRMAKQTQWAYHGSNDQSQLKKTLAYRLAFHPDNHPSWLKPVEPFYSRSIAQNKILFFEVVHSN